MLAINLPTEIWLEIFELATLDPLLLASDYRAFQPIHHNRRPTGLSTLRTLCLVCKCWNALASAILYKDIRIQYGMTNLLRALQQSAVSLASGPDAPAYTNGHTVRRLYSRVRQRVNRNSGQKSCPTLQRHWRCGIYSPIHGDSARLSWTRGAR